MLDKGQGFDLTDFTQIFAHQQFSAPSRPTPMLEIIIFVKGLRKPSSFLKLRPRRFFDFAHRKVEPGIGPLGRRWDCSARELANRKGVEP